MKYALLLLLPCGWLLAAPGGFTFSDYCSLKPGSTFSIEGQGNPADGKGKVIAISKNFLHLTFAAGALGRSVKASLKLKLIRSERFKHVFRFTYNDDLGRSASKVDEDVAVDRFAAERGMLTFMYAGDKEYFQMQKKAAGKCLAVVTWGRLLLEAQ